MSIETALAPLFPSWALRRMQAKHAFEAVRGHYEGAKQGRRTRGWRTTGSSANAETRHGLPILRDRSRDLVRNNPYAAAGLDVMVAYQVGTGLLPSSNTGDRDLDKQADDLWREWANFADLMGMLDIYGLQSLAARTRSEAGEVLIQVKPLGSADWRASRSPIPLQISVLEPDYIDTARIGRLPDGWIEQGIEFDLNGRRRAFWLFDRHPGDQFAIQLRGFASRRVPVENVLHVLKIERPGQERGVPDLAPVMTRLRMLDDYEDAALEQARVQACLAAFVTSGTEFSKGPLEGPRDGESGQRRRSLAPGMIERLLPGEDVKFNTTPAPQGISDFARHQLHAVAAGLGPTYDLMTGDLTQANYSSLRAGRLAFKRRLEHDQWMMLVPMMCEPIYDRFIYAAQLVGALPMTEGRWKRNWNVPRFDLLDPGSEYEAVRTAVRSGFMTQSQAIAEFGGDPREQIDLIAADNKALDDAGIILDTDPRRVSNAGLAQDAKQNARVQIAATGPA